MALLSVAHANEDERPASHDIPPPPGDFSERALDVPRAPPPDGWWKKKQPCVRGTRLETKKTKLGREEWTSYTCVGKSEQPRAYTALRSDGEREEWWLDSHGERHGGLRQLSSQYETTELYVHGVKEGRQALRARNDLGDSFAHYRDGKHHGLAQEALSSGSNSRASVGYYVDGYREGIWIVWNTAADLVRARLRYRNGQLDGEQRWWNRDGTVLARGRFVNGDGSWTIEGKTETRCKRGERTGICDDPTVPPLGRF
jgi:antitoxin component YwqK of YwqJK toxin-antitoxin module